MLGFTKSQNNQFSELLKLIYSEDNLEILLFSKSDVQVVNLYNILIEDFKKRPNNRNFTLESGKLGLIFLAVLLINYEDSITDKLQEFNCIENYLVENEIFILSENYENSFANGRTGILFVLLHLYSYHQSERLKNMIRVIVEELFRRAKFDKKGISWMPDKYSIDNLSSPESINNEIYFVLSLVAKQFNNKDIMLLLSSINRRRIKGKNKYMTDCFFENKSKRREFLNLSNPIFELFNSNFQKHVIFIKKNKAKKMLVDFKRTHKCLNQYLLFDFMKSNLSFKKETDLKNYKLILDFQIKKARVLGRSNLFTTLTDELDYFRSCQFLDTMDNNKLFKIVFMFNKKNHVIIDNYPWAKLSNINFMQGEMDYFDKLRNQNDYFITLLRCQRFENEIIIELLDIIDYQIVLFYFFYEKETTIEKYKLKLDSQNKIISDDKLRTFLLLLVRMGVFIPIGGYN